MILNMLNKDGETVLSKLVQSSDDIVWLFDTFLEVYGYVPAYTWERA